MIRTRGLSAFGFRLSAFASVVVTCAAWAAPPVVTAQLTLEPGKLYFNVGVVDTDAMENLKSRSAAAFQGSAPHVIQLNGPLTPQQRQELRRIGIVPQEYLPAHAYVADLKNAAPDALNKLPFVRWVGPFQKEWKLDPELGRRVFQKADRQAMASRGESAVMVTLFSHRPAGTVLAHLGALPGAIVHYVEDEGGTIVVSAKIRTADAAGLAALDDVHYVEDAPEITLRNITTRWIVQSNITDVTPLYDNGITGVGQIVGVMDSLVNRDHCSFRDPVDNTPGPSHRKIVAYNTTFGYALHGTHVSGIAIGQDFNGSTGETRGVAYDGRLVYSPIPSGTETGFYNAAQQAHTQGARVHTNSWGNDGTTNYDSLCRGIDSFSYDFEDDLVCFAVTNTSLLKNPENAKNLLAVGASRDTPNQNNFCTGTSGAGPTADGRRKPEIYAPGCSTQSASGSGQVCTTTALTGTSMASPAIAGTGLLVRQYYTDGYYPTGIATPANSFTPSGALVKATLLNSAVDMTGITGYPSNREGWGRVLADNTLFFPGDARTFRVAADIRNASGLVTNDQNEYPFQVQSTGQFLKIALVWTDPPASASTGAGNAAINDLDLEVVAPDSTLYLGNDFSGGQSTTGGVKDAKNNVEMVLLNAPAVGAWTARVKAAAVNQGTQGYALVISGNVSDMLPPPTVFSITPNTGDSGSVVSITSLTGSNFQTSGTTVVKLLLIGQPDILATNVNVVSPTLITFDFDLTSAEPGAYDVVVINPDLRSGGLSGSFRVNLNCLKGDVNRDGFVDGADIGRFSEIAVNGGELPVERCAADVDPMNDGVVNDLDVPNFVDCVLNEGCP